MSNIQQAILDAQAAAANLAANQNLTVQQGGQTAVAIPSQGRKITGDDFDQGGMSVDSFLKVNEFGLRIGDDMSLIPMIKVKIDMATVAYSEVIKAGKSTYFKTFDGATSTSGGSWEAAILKAQSIDAKARPYKSADIMMVVLEEVVHPATKKVLAKAGMTLGHSLSTTNRANFSKFRSEVEAAVGSKDSGIVEVELSAEPKSNTAGNVWGVLTFRFLGESAD